MQAILKLSDEEASAIRLETTPLDVRGWTSLAHVQLILELEKVFDTTFDADEIAALASVDAIAGALERRQS